MRLEILKIFLSDAEIQAKYGITQTQVDKLTISTEQQNDMIATCQQLLTVTDGNTTVAAAAANLNGFLTTRLKNKQ